MKKEVSPNSKILRKIVIGIAVYAGTYLLSILVFSAFSAVMVYGTALVGTLASLVSGVAAFLTITSPEKGPLFYNKEARFAKKPYFILITVVSAYALTVVFNFTFSLLPWEKLGSSHIVQDNESFYSIPLYLRLISYVLIGPFSEEVLFRGVIFSRFRKLIPLWAAALASAVFFALYHGNLMQGIYAFFMGFMMCVVMDLGGSILLALAFHITANLISNLCFEFEYINNVVYSTPGIILSAAYVVVAIIICIVYILRLTKKDKKC